MSKHRPARFGRGRSGLIIVAALGVAVNLPASAQVLEDIVVTAQKREQNVQDVPIAISAFTGDQMKTLGVEQSFDIATFAPGVHISGNLAGQNTQFTIRGVTQNDFNDIIEAPNAVYLDEGYIPIAQAQTFALFDIERVEILKGPQGTLFGRNATGGLVQYVSRKPNYDEWEGFADVTYGTYDTDGDADAESIRLEAALGGPITGAWAGRISGLYNNQDAYLENLYDPTDEFAFGAATIGAGPGNAPGFDAGADLGDDETVALRGILQYEPSDELRFTFSANWASTDVATGPYQSKPTTAVYNGSNPDPAVQLSTGELVNVIDTPRDDSRRSICADGSDCGSDQDNDGFPDDFDGDSAADIFRVNNTFSITEGTDFFGYRDPNGDDFTFSGDFAFGDSGSTDTKGLAMRIEWDTSDAMTITSITDFKDYEKLLFIDVDSAPVNQSANYAGVDATSFMQEIRANGSTESARWVVGLFYLNIDTESDNGLKFPVNSVVPGPFDLGSDAALETDSYSLYGQYEYDVVENITATIGARVIREEKDYVFSQNIYGTSDSRKIHQGPAFQIGPVFDSNGVPQDFVDETDDTLWAGKVQLDWRPNEDWLVYAGVNRGVKAGSFNAQLAGGLPIDAGTIPYDEEILWAYETGFKSSWLDGTTRINGSVFYYDYEDYQAFLFTGVGGVVINADSENVGVELELQTSPIDGLDILLSAAWFDAEVQDVPFRTPLPGEPAPCTSGSPVICQDVDPVYAPETQVAGLIRYEWPLFGGMASIQGDFSYSDDYFYNLRNFDADQYDSYTLVNAIIGWSSPDEHWDISLAARNITDERAGIQGFDLATLCGCNEISYRAPRWYGISVKYSL